MWETFEQALPMAWVIVPLGALSALTSILGLILAARRSRLTPRLGVALILAAALASALGVAGVVHGRHRAEAPVGAEDLLPVEREHRLRRGHAEARSAAALGLGSAALPLLAGVLMMIGRRPPLADEDDSPPPLPRFSRRVEVGAVMSALLTSLVAAAAHEAPLPGRELSANHARWRLREALEEVTSAEDHFEIGAACRRFEAALEDNRAHLGRALPRPLRAANKACVEQRIQEAALLSRLPVIRAAMEALSTSPMADLDPEARGLIDAAMGEVRQIPEDDGREAAALPALRVRVGDVEVEGRLPKEVVTRIVRTHVGRFRLCAERGSSPRADGSSQLAVRFVVGRDGSVKSAVSERSSHPDPEVTNCVVRAFDDLSFPEPDGGVATVVCRLDIQSTVGG